MSILTLHKVRDILHLKLNVGLQILIALQTFSYGASLVVSIR
jgi:hypothetical protein